MLLKMTLVCFDKNVRIWDLDIAIGVTLRKLLQFKDK